MAWTLSSIGGRLSRPSRTYRPASVEGWRAALACPSCKGGLEHGAESLDCKPCRVSYPIVAGRPVFHAEGSGARVMPESHVSNQLSGEVKAWLSEVGLALNLGAGGTGEKLANVVELEWSIFRHTDVAADAHHLPFADEAFDAVVTFNTFEHLYDPPKAAREILRVLKPGGRLVLQTAFLQPVHEPPHHYYNTTEFGLRKWFADFDIMNVHVTGNFNPAYVLAWLSSAMLYHVGNELGVEAHEALSRTDLASWARSWADPNQRSGPGWEVLQRLSPELQKQFAAGFQLEAVKRAG
jgi:SAM-dependent methyltransferase